MIFCLEDDDSIRALEVYALTGAGLAARGFADAAAFFAAVAGEVPQLVILDIMLPDEDGLAVLRRLREAPATRAVPVLMATARGSEYDTVLGLDSGADDYLAKPFGMMELVSRAKALLRRARAAAPADDVVRLGPIALCQSAYRVSVDGVNVELTHKEFELLSLLMRHAEQVFTRDALLDAVWGYEAGGETRTVDVHMRTLRQKLGPAGGLYLETVRGVGYRASAHPAAARP